MKIAVAKGDGIGPEIMDAVLKIFNANQVPLEYEMVEMGKWCSRTTHRTTPRSPSPRTAAWARKVQPAGMRRNSRPGSRRR